MVAGADDPNVGTGCRPPCTDVGPWQLLAWPFTAPCPADKQNAMFTHDASSGQLKLGTVEADRVVPA